MRKMATDKGLAIIEYLIIAAVVILAMQAVAAKLGGSTETLFTEAINKVPDGIGQ